jgi:magnesium transporter
MLTQDGRIALAEITDLNQLKRELIDLPAIDVGEFIAELPEGRRAIAFRLLKKSKATEVFEYLQPDVRETLIGSLHDAQVHHLIEEMSPDDRAELFDELPAGVVRRLIQGLSVAERQATATILGYPEGTAGRVMTTEYVRLQEGLTVEQALDKMRRRDQDKETIYYAYLTDPNRKLLSVVSLRQLLFSMPDVKLTDIASDRLIRVQTDTPREEAAQVMMRYDLIAVPVVDREDRLVGIVTIDDMVDVLEEEATEDIQKIAGVTSGNESSLSLPLEKLKNRLPWLLGIMVLYTGASSAISPFQKTIAAIPVMAVIMPLFSNTGGTVGIQALTVTVRSLSVGEVTPADTVKILQRELQAGLGAALSLGTMMVLLSLIWTKPGERWVGWVAGLVMATNTLVAVTLGTLLPIGMKRLNLDPALASGPLVTTLLDTIGFILFLTMITLSLNVFGMSAN